LKVQENYVLLHVTTNLEKNVVDQNEGTRLDHLIQYFLSEWSFENFDLVWIECESIISQNIFDFDN